MKLIEASYEKGLLRPAKPLPLGEGECVRVIILRRANPSRWNLARIAAVTGEEDAELAEAGLDQWAAALDSEDTK